MADPWAAVGRSRSAGGSNAAGRRESIKMGFDRSSSMISLRNPGQSRRSGCGHLNPNQGPGISIRSKALTRAGLSPAAGGGLPVGTGDTRRSPPFGKGIGPGMYARERLLHDTRRPSIHRIDEAICRCQEKLPQLRLPGALATLVSLPGAAWTMLKKVDNVFPGTSVDGTLLPGPQFRARRSGRRSAAVYPASRCRPP